MKYLLIILTTLLPLVALGQNTPDTSKFGIPDTHPFYRPSRTDLVQRYTDLLLPASEFGWRETNVFDTIKTLLQVKVMQSSWPEVIKGYTIREKYEYFGDRIPGGNYSDMWQGKDFLDASGKKINAYSIEQL